MWQVILAAAVAGSTSLVAKHFFNPFSRQNQKRSDGDIHREEQEETPREDEGPQTPAIKSTVLQSRYESNGDIFRFSSTDSSGKLKYLRRKSRFRARGLKKKEVNARVVTERSGGGVDLNRRRVSICSKKQKTNKITSSNFGSCLNKDNSLFGWGLGVGIMYMMSAGKAEINKLNSAMNETEKVVQELKEELHRRKSSRSIQVLGSACEVNPNSEKNIGKNNQSLSVPPSESGEYASSVLTEEPEPEIVEMGRLEAELESELQKLPLSSTGASKLEGIQTNLGKPGDSAQVDSNLADQGPESYQCNGVSPSVLDQKLCHLLIEQQENQIEELESELHTAQSKLNQKEAELQALKECVKRLTEFSLSSNLSDDEPERNQEDGLSNNARIQHSSKDHEPRKSTVGMKRPNDSQ